MMRKHDLPRYGLWAALALALAGTLKHSAWAFATLENGDMTAGYIQAIAVDVGMAAIAASIQQRRRAQQATLWLWLGAGAFCAVSIYANLLHGYKFASTLETPLADWRPYVLSAVLPLLLFYLTEIVSHAPRPATQSVPAVAPSETLAPPAFAPIAQAVALSEPSAALPAASEWLCETCGRSFGSRNALIAHQRAHKSA